MPSTPAVCGVGFALTRGAAPAEGAAPPGSPQNSQQIGSARKPSARVHGTGTVAPAFVRLILRKCEPGPRLVRTPEGASPPHRCSRRAGEDMKPQTNPAGRGRDLAVMTLEIA